MKSQVTEAQVAAANRGESDVAPHMSWPTATPNDSRRRQAISTIGKGGLALLLGVGAFLRAPLKAKADGNCHLYGCCCLKYYASSNCYYTCAQASGYYYRSWSCTYGGCWLYTCYECAHGPSCYSDPWLCSNYSKLYIC
jgi:hypothetical protein